MSFADRVYAVCKRIPKGRVSSYGAIAKVLNSSPRAVGQALRCNPFAPVVPCHRVVKSDGTIGGFMGEIEGKEVKRKIKLLSDEGVVVKDGKIDASLFWDV